MAHKKTDILEGLSWIGILGMIVFVCVLIFGDVSKNGKYTASIACIIGLAYPICKTLLSGNSDEAIGSGMISAIGGLVLAIILGLVFKKSTNDGFILDFLNALISKGFLWFYLILLLLSSYLATKDKNLAMITSGILIGFLTPIIIAGVVTLILIAIGLIVVFALSKSSNGTSTTSSVTNSHKNMEHQSKDGFGGGYVYSVTYKDLSDGRVKSSSYYTYDTPKSSSEVERDFRSKYWNNGENLIVIKVVTEYIKGRAMH